MYIQDEYAKWYKDVESGLTQDGSSAIFNTIGLHAMSGLSTALAIPAFMDWAQTNAEYGTLGFVYVEDPDHMSYADTVSAMEEANIQAWTDFTNYVNEYLKEATGGAFNLGSVSSVVASAIQSAECMAVASLIGNVCGVSNLAAEFATHTGLSTEAAKAAGTKAMEKFVGTYTNAVFYLSGCQQKMPELSEDGRYTKEQVYLLANGAGIIEGLTERFSIESLFSIASARNLTSGITGFLSDMFKQTFCEGTEELTGNIANWAWDNITAKVLVPGARTEYEHQIEDYIAQGYSRSEAASQVNADWWAETRDAFVQGALSGALGGFGATITNTVTQSAIGNNYKAISKGLAESVVAEEDGNFANKNAAIGIKKMAQKILDGKASSSDIGVFVSSLEQDSLKHVDGYMLANQESMAYGNDGDYHLRWSEAYKRANLEVFENNMDKFDEALSNRFLRDIVTDVNGNVSFGTSAAGQENQKILDGIETELVSNGMDVNEASSVKNFIIQCFTGNLTYSQEKISSMVSSVIGDDSQTLTSVYKFLKDNQQTSDVVADKITYDLDDVVDNNYAEVITKALQSAWVNTHFNISSSNESYRARMEQNRIVRKAQEQVNQGATPVTSKLLKALRFCELVQRGQIARDSTAVLSGRKNASEVSSQARNTALRMALSGWGNKHKISEHYVDSKRAELAMTINFMRHKANVEAKITESAKKETPKEEWASKINVERHADDVVEDVGTHTKSVRADYVKEEMEKGVSEELANQRFDNAFIRGLESAYDTKSTPGTKPYVNADEQTAEVQLAEEATEAETAEVIDTEIDRLEKVTKSDERPEVKEVAKKALSKLQLQKQIQELNLRLNNVDISDEDFKKISAEKIQLEKQLAELDGRNYEEEEPVSDFKEDNTPTETEEEDLDAPPVEYVEEALGVSSVDYTEEQKAPTPIKSKTEAKSEKSGKKAKKEVSPEEKLKALKDRLASKQTEIDAKKNKNTKVYENLQTGIAKLKSEIAELEAEIKSKKGEKDDGKSSSELGRSSNVGGQRQGDSGTSGTVEESGTRPAERRTARRIPTGEEPRRNGLRILSWDKRTDKKTITEIKDGGIGGVKSPENYTVAQKEIAKICKDVGYDVAFVVVEQGATLIDRSGNSCYALTEPGRKRIIISVEANSNHSTRAWSGEQDGMHEWLHALLDAVYGDDATAKAAMVSKLIKAVLADVKDKELKAKLKDEYNFLFISYAMVDPEICQALGFKQSDDLPTMAKHLGLTVKTSSIESLKSFIRQASGKMKEKLSPDLWARLKGLVDEEFVCDAVGEICRVKMADTPGKLGYSLLSDRDTRTIKASLMKAIKQEKLEETGHKRATSYSLLSSLGLTNEEIEVVRKYSAVNTLLNLDSNGRILSQGQIEYFKDSQARDSLGRLLLLYHGARNIHEFFDPEKIGDSGALFLSTSLAVAASYSGVDGSMSIPEQKFRKEQALAKGSQDFTERIEGIENGFKSFSKELKRLVPKGSKRLEQALNQYAFVIGYVKQLMQEDGVKSGGWMMGRAMALSAYPDLMRAVMSCYSPIEVPSKEATKLVENYGRKLNELIGDFTSLFVSNLIFLSHIKSK